MLHIYQTNDQVPGQTASAATGTSLHVSQVKNTCTSLIVPVYISHVERPSQEVMVYALLDTQSDTTFIVDSVCKDLGVSGQDTTLLLSTMVGVDVPVRTTKIQGLIVRGLGEASAIRLPPTYTRHMMPVNEHHIPTPEVARKWPHLRKVAKLMSPLQKVKVGLLIGYNCPQALIPRDVVCSTNSSEPYAQRTDLGWAILGSTQADPSDCIGLSHRTLTLEVPEELRNGDAHSQQLVFASRNKESFAPMDLHQLLGESMETTNADSDEHFSQDDKRFLSVVKEGIHHNEGKIEMPLPLREENCRLPDNRLMALQRLNGLKKRLQGDPQMHDEYKDFMEEMIRNKHAERIEEKIEPEEGKIWYLPHHAVRHPTKKKLRVVFDCSARFRGTSLNDVLCQGPDLINSLVGLLCRFRLHRIAFACDIEKMFFQFLVNDEHRNFLRFLWWNNGNLQEEPCEYRMRVHLFGATSSPSCAMYGLRQVANNNRDEFGDIASEFLQHDFYVDDGLKSVGTEEEAIKIIHSSREMCRKSGIRLHKFVSNSRRVLESVPKEDRAVTEWHLNFQPQVERTLGIHWCIQSDTLQFRISLRDCPLTRRGILSTVCSIYDPLGIVAPVILEGKLILRLICQDGKDWDDPISEESRERWQTWRSQLHLLEKIQVNRCPFKDLRKVVRSEFHFFSDASSIGLGQSTYLRQVDEDGNVACAFLMGKAKVAPSKVLTIPRLELAAAVFSVKMCLFMRAELKIPEVTEYFWTDSTVTLGFIGNNARRFHVFVANRVQQIQDATDPKHWFHVKGEDNPADEGSRGISVQHLIEGSKWLEGPQFLQKRDLVIPTLDVPELESSDPEVRTSVFAQTTQQPFNLVDCLKRVSTWDRAKRTVAIWRRYLLILKAKAGLAHSSKEDLFGSLKVNELQEAQFIIIGQVQKQSFKEFEAMKHQDHSKRPALKRSSALRKLDPVYSEGLLRVGGRIRRANIPRELAHPVLLPKSHHIVTLIVRHFHNKTFHSGRGTTLNEIRANGFWIISARAVITSVITKCVACNKFRGQPACPKMSDLPSDRMEPSPPFTFCGVDFFGPFYVTQGRSSRKRWGSLFTCLVSRAVHIEIAHNLTTDSFINAYRRFVSRRGPIRTLRCDQGTNFVGAKSELASAIAEMDQEEIRRKLLSENCDVISFNMNHPKSSHMGGAWERMIRSVRNALNHLLPRQGSQLDDELLLTLMAEVEAVINSRPLTFLDDQDAPVPLSPAHLLTMKNKLILPLPGKFDSKDMYCRKRWRRIQYLANEFWQRWKKEYLPTLQKRTKWQDASENLQVGDVVICKEDGLQRGAWPLARIVKVHESSDDVIRSVTVRNVNGCYRRPATKIVLLLRPDSDEPE